MDSVLLWMGGGGWALFGLVKVGGVLFWVGGGGWAIIVGARVVGDGWK